MNRLKKNLPVKDECKEPRRASAGRVSEPEGRSAYLKKAMEALKGCKCGCMEWLVSDFTPGPNTGIWVLWAKLCSLQLYMLKCQPPVPQNVTVFGDRDLKKVLKLKQSHYGGPYFIMTSVLIRKGNWDTNRYKGKMMWKHKKTAIYKLRKEASEETPPC